MSSDTSFLTTTNGTAPASDTNAMDAAVMQSSSDTETHNDTYTISDADTSTVIDPNHGTDTNDFLTTSNDPTSNDSDTDKTAETEESIVAGTSSDTAINGDSATETDTSTELSTRTDTDTGTEADAGVETDTTIQPDAGTDTENAVATDTRTETDTRVATDTRTETDTRVATDTRIATDTTIPTDTASDTDIDLPSSCDEMPSSTLYSFDADTEQWELAAIETFPMSLSWQASAGTPIASGVSRLDADPGGESIFFRRTMSATNLSGVMVSARVLIESGENAGVRVYMQSGATYQWADSGTFFPSHDTWVCIALDASNPDYQTAEFDPNETIAVGVQFFSDTPLTVYVDDVRY